MGATFAEPGHVTAAVRCFFLFSHRVFLLAGFGSVASRTRSKGRLTGSPRKRFCGAPIFCGSGRRRTGPCEPAGRPPFDPLTAPCDLLALQPPAERSVGFYPFPP